jgi:hypothetical protein
MHTVQYFDQNPMQLVSILTSTKYFCKNVYMFCIDYDTLLTLQDIQSAAHKAKPLNKGILQWKNKTSRQPFTAMHWSQLHLHSYQQHLHCCVLSQECKMIESIQKYMSELKWTVVDLHQQTDIDIAVLQDILKGDVKPSYSDVMLIVLAITKQYPKDKNWEIYHSIMVSPIFRRGRA